MLMDKLFSYLWQQTSGKSVTLENADLVNASFKTPKPKRGSTLALDFILTVTDNDGATATEAVRIVVSN